MQQATNSEAIHGSLAEPRCYDLDLKGLRRLYDVVESNVMGLQALGVQSSVYGGLLTPILISKLPSETERRELKEGEWEFGAIMKVVRERLWQESDL